MGARFTLYQLQASPKMPLTDLEIKYATLRKRPYKLFDGQGLYLLVQPGGTKLWRLKYHFDGKEKVLNFGKYPEVAAAAARQKRKDAKATLKEGVDPAVSLARPDAPTTFEPIARAWHANRAESLDAAHASRVIRRMERDAFPALGARPIDEIDAPEVLDVIRAVEARGALDISRRLKQGISQVFRFAIASGWAETDPTVSLNDALRPKPKVRHRARVSLAELPELVEGIRNYDGEADSRRRETTRDAMLFTLLTWARTSETRFCEWDEFEELGTENALWRISPERMKMEREHLVPLSSQVSEMLLRRKRTSNDRFVFPGEKPGQPISENTMIYACYRMGYLGKQTVHGFRGLGSTWANEAECYRPDWVEMALAHVDEDEVRGAYNSALYLTPRRRMLQDWADHLDGNHDAAGGKQPSIAPRQSAIIKREIALPKPQPVGAGRPIFWQRPRTMISRGA
jgi:integrase